MSKTLSANFSAKNALSAPSAPVLLSAGLTAEDRSALAENGFSACVMHKKQPYLYNIDLGEYVPLSAIRAEYRENREGVAAEWDVHSFREWLDCLTAMGGSCCDVKRFFCPIISGKPRLDMGDDEAEWAIQNAIDFCKFEEEEGRKPSVRIAAIFCPVYYEMNVRG